MQGGERVGARVHAGVMQLAEVIATSERVRSTRSRTDKTAALAATLSAAAAEGDAHLVAVTADYLAGVLPQRRIGVGWRGLRALPGAAVEPSLTVAQVDDALARIGLIHGAGSSAGREQAVAELFDRATEAEQRWLSGLIVGEMRQGAGDGILQQAVASAAEITVPAVRRAVMLAGFVGPVAAAALTAHRRGGSEAALAALGEIHLEVGRPLRPMLAAGAPSIEESATWPEQVAIESKLDGIRLQAHLNRDVTDPADRVRLFTRTLEDVTARMPEVVELVEALPATRAVLDGEVIVERDGRPAPFQETGSRTMSSTDPDEQRSASPLTSYFFDLLHLDGSDLLDEPAAQRFEALQRLTPGSVVPRMITTDPEEAAQFFADRVAAGHEGVVVKSLDAPYAAGRRGAGWVKVKPRHTLDLVVLAVEQGSGRRAGWLSNIHLGARDEQTGQFVMLGKTFKGMTDEMLTWQTERFGELAAQRDDWLVTVRPEQVVEIAFDGVQRSSRYPGGVALRFARVLRYRDDKPVSEIDTLQSVRALLP